MRPFEYIRATDPAQAVATVAARPGRGYLAGGTTQLDLMLKDGIVSPERLVDITRLPLKWITADADAIRVGATTTMEELAADPTVSERLPFVREALLDSASVQLRNMATIGGNLLQRTRCRYFRDPAVDACNKRRPGPAAPHVTGRPGCTRSSARPRTASRCTPPTWPCRWWHWTRSCTSWAPAGCAGCRSPSSISQPGDTPDIENVLAHGELITEIEIPLLPAAARSAYLKVRDRASYEFALTSAAVAVVLEAGVIRTARIALGGVGTVPWRARAAEDGAARRTGQRRDLPRRGRGSGARPVHRARHRVQSRAGQTDARAGPAHRDRGDAMTTIEPARLVGPGIDRVDGPAEGDRLRAIPGRFQLSQYGARRARARHGRRRADPPDRGRGRRGRTGRAGRHHPSQRPASWPRPRHPAVAAAACAAAGRPDPALRPVHRHGGGRDGRAGGRRGSPHRDRLRAGRAPAGPRRPPGGGAHQPVGAGCAPRRRGGRAGGRRRHDRGDLHHAGRDQQPDGAVRHGRGLGRRLAHRARLDPVALSASGRRSRRPSGSPRAESGCSRRSSGAGSGPGFGSGRTWSWRRWRRGRPGGRSSWC